MSLIHELIEKIKTSTLSAGEIAYLHKTLDKEEDNYNILKQNIKATKKKNGKQFVKISNEIRTTIKEIEKQDKKTFKYECSAVTMILVSLVIVTFSGFIGMATMLGFHIALSIAGLSMLSCVPIGFKIRRCNKVLNYLKDKLKSLEAERLDLINNNAEIKMKENAYYSKKKISKMIDNIIGSEYNRDNFYVVKDLEDGM